VDGYYGELLALVEQGVSDGFIHPVHRNLLLADADPERLFDLLSSSKVPHLDKWLDRTQV